MDVGIPPAAGIPGFQRIDRQDDSTRLHRELSISDGWRQPPGALQHSVESTTVKPGAARKKVLCGNAHSSGRWSNRRCGAFFRWGPDFLVMELHHLDAHHCGDGISDGEHLALLQF